MDIGKEDIQWLSSVIEQDAKDTVRRRQVIHCGDP